MRLPFGPPVLTRAVPAPTLAGVAAALAFTGQGAAAQPAAGPTVQARVFADVGYLNTPRPVPGGFRLGQVAGHLVARLSDRVNIFGEATASPLATGFAFEVERLIMRYEHSDRLKLSAGRYHTPLGYWNTAFHHGTWLQTTVARPEMIRAGSNLLPVHFVGAMAEGSVHAGPIGAGYSLGVGNGRGASTGRAGDAGDANKSLAVVAGTTVRLPQATGTQVGIAYYSDRVTPTAAMDVRERTIAVHLARERETPEVIVEYARVQHDARRPVVRTAASHVYYGQLAYRLPRGARAFKPYVRVERNRVPAADTLLSPLRLTYAGLTGGVRVDAGVSTALKLEYRAERVDRGRRMGTFAAQVSFTFAGAADHDHRPAEPAVAAAESDAPRGAHHD